MTQRRDRQKSGIFHDHLMVLDHIQKSHDQLVVIDGDDFIDILLKIREHMLARCLHGCPVRDGADSRKCHNMTGLQRSRKTCCPGRFDTNHLDVRVQHLCQRGHACRQSAAADRNQDILHKRKVLEDLHHDRPLAGRNGRIIKRMNEGIALLLRKLQRIGAGFIVHISVQNNFRSV